MKTPDYWIQRGIRDGLFAASRLALQASTLGYYTDPARQGEALGRIYQAAYDIYDASGGCASVAHSVRTCLHFALHVEVDRG